jgi:hypothetical protein
MPINTNATSQASWNMIQNTAHTIRTYRTPECVEFLFYFLIRTDDVRTVRGDGFEHVRELRAIGVIRFPKEFLIGDVPLDT